MSEEDSEIDVSQEETEEKVTEEEEDSEFPAVSLQDIELLMKNTEIWHELLKGKISVEEAKKILEENASQLESRSTSKKQRKKSPEKKLKRKEPRSELNAQG
ncbi:MAG: RNA polymerase subunit Rpo13 [Candidatus Aramenus sulfurataquae]|uniref:RNA polymerase subunit Rpo13 n=1 Tax=Candidatus Aramenus sulfurataquae TaxID=1326980 RepID=A0ACC6TME2_9CREN